MQRMVVIKPPLELESKIKECEKDEKNKYKMIIFLAIIVLSAVVIYKSMKTKNTTKYTYDNLKALSAKELYEVFLENGLKVEEELKTYMSDDEIANIVLRG